MKKFLLLAALSLCLPASAVFEPEWSEFSPAAYINIDTTKSYILDEKKYWSARKIDFEKKKGYCLAMPEPDEKHACFKELRELQASKNRFYSAYIAQQQEIQLERERQRMLYDTANHLIRTIGK
jgi:hypothetical protein